MAAAQVFFFFFFQNHKLLLFYLYFKQIERVIATIRKLISRAQVVEPGATVKSLIPKAFSNYNHKYHSTVRMSPAEAMKPENKAQVFINVYKKVIEAKPFEPKYKVTTNEPVRLTSHVLLC